MSIEMPSSTRQVNKNYILYKRNKSKVSTIRLNNVPKMILDNDSFIKAKNSSQFHSDTNTHRNMQNFALNYKRSRIIRAQDSALLKYPTVGVTTVSSRLRDFPVDKPILKIREALQNEIEEIANEKVCNSCKKKDRIIKKLESIIKLSTDKDIIKGLQTQMEKLTKENSLLHSNIKQINLLYSEKNNMAISKINKENVQLKKMLSNITYEQDKLPEFKHTNTIVESLITKSTNSPNNAYARTLSKFQSFQSTLKAISEQFTVLNEILGSEEFVNEMYLGMEEHEVMDRAYAELQKDHSKWSKQNKKSAEYLSLAKRLMNDLSAESEKQSMMQNVLSQHSILADHLKSLCTTYDTFTGFMNTFFSMSKCDYVQVS